MTSRLFQVFVGMSIWCSVVWFAFYSLNIGKIEPIEGAELLKKGQICAPISCDKPSQVQLPHFVPFAFQKGVVLQNYAFGFQFDGAIEGVYAVYIPRVRHDVRLMVNGSVIRTAESDGRRWNRPIFSTIPQSVLRVGHNEISLEVVSIAQEGAELQPFYVGPRELLQSAYQFRFLTTVFVAQFSTGLMVIMSAVFLIIFLFSRQEQMYFFLFSSCVFSAILSYNFALDTSWINYKLWTLIWMFATPAFVHSLAMFIRFSVGFDVGPIEKTIGIGLLIAVGLGTLLPEEYIYRYALWMNFGTAGSAMLVTSWFWCHSDGFQRRDFVVMFVCMSLAMGFGYYLMYMLLWPEPSRTQHLFAFMPFTMVFMCLWLLLSRFVRSLDDFRALSLSQEKTIASKTAELAESYKKLAIIEGRQAAHRERQRIMLDLHDGLGGQLTNALAYMENNGHEDLVLRNALEHALQDLGLMLDSMETEGSVATLLGMLRMRLEPLVAQYGLAFDWQIETDPALPNSGPSQNLNLLRIVQEAITNAIKHAQAKTIKVQVRQTSISISDDGVGFSQEHSLNEKLGYGLISMRKRAEQLGAVFTLNSDASGTTIALNWTE